MLYRYFLYTISDTLCRYLWFRHMLYRYFLYTTSDTQCRYLLYNIVGIYYSYSTYYEMKNLNTTGTQEFIFTTDLSYYLTLEKTWLAFGCTSATITLILLLIILFLRKRIMIAIALIKEGSRYANTPIYVVNHTIGTFSMTEFM